MAIVISGLKKSFGKFQALKGINLEVADGEVFGFLGPNGAGKTTTINCMLDFLRPDAGSITIDALDSKKDALKIQALCGLVPSDPYFYSHWTGNDHFDLIEGFRGRTSLKTKLIKDFDFDPGKKVGDLSTGNRQKLSLILAMMHEPKILILDEPTRGLDPLLQNVFYSHLRALQEKGSTIFMSSHNLAEIENSCSRVGIIREGRIIEVANIDDLKQKSVYFVHVLFEDHTRLTVQDLTNRNIEIVKKFDHSLELKVAGPIAPALKLLNTQKIRDISITKANLEEIFLEFYK